MLIGWEEYNYFINCTAVHAINDFPKTNKMAERYFKHKCEMKIRTKAPNFGWKSCRTRLWRENMMLTLRSIQICHANNKQNANKVQLRKKNGCGN
jgi:hypothetical protein